MALTAKISLFQLDDSKWSFRVKYPMDESTLVRGTMAIDEYETKEEARVAAEAQAQQYASTSPGTETYEFNPETNERKPL